jgi:hypothetical protein
MRFPRLFRAAPFRLALAFAGTLTGSSIAIFGYIYWQTAEVEIDQKHRYLELEAQEAIQVPEPLLLEQVKTRLANDLHYNTYSALFDAHGARVAGNLAEIPPICRSTVLLTGSWSRRLTARRRRARSP